VRSSASVEGSEREGQATPKFDEIGFGTGMTARYMENNYAIVAVNFPERLLGLADSPTLHPDDTFWVREENAVIHASPVPKPNHDSTHE